MDIPVSHYWKGEESGPPVTVSKTPVLLQYLNPSLEPSSPLPDKPFHAFRDIRDRDRVVNEEDLLPFREEPACQVNVLEKDIPAEPFKRFELIPLERAQGPGRVYHAAHPAAKATEKRYLEVFDPLEPGEKAGGIAHLHRAAGGSDLRVPVGRDKPGKGPGL